MRVISKAEYDARIIAGLIGLGYSGPEARAICLSRFEAMNSVDMLAELAGRGIKLEISDLADFFLDRYGPGIDVAGLEWISPQVDTFLGWALANGRGEPAGVRMVGVADMLEALRKATGPQPEPEPAVLTLPEMISALRSDDLGQRIQGGLLIATSLGAGLALQGEEELDVEHIVSPAISDMLGRAMAGEEAAVAWLEASLTVDKEGNPIARAEGSRDARR